MVKRRTLRGKKLLIVSAAIATAGFAGSCSERERGPGPVANLVLPPIEAGMESGTDDSGAMDASEPVDASEPMDAAEPMDASEPMDANGPADAAEPVDASEIWDAPVANLVPP